jgi:hypothetical protein
MLFLGTLLPLAFGEGLLQATPCLGLSSVKRPTAWERAVTSELAWAQSFLPPLSQQATGTGLRGCSPCWLASAKTS